MNEKKVDSRPPCEVYGDIEHVYSDPASKSIEGRLISVVFMSIWSRIWVALRRLVSMSYR